jgi:hypothetical protein
MWIKCSERQPEKYQKVLFMAKDAENPFPRSHMIGYRVGSEWVATHLFYGSDTLNDLVDITHWQELPDYPID